MIESSNMDRRNFLGMMIGDLAASAALRTWPFRVYSFPQYPTSRRVDFLDLSRWAAPVNVNVAEGGLLVMPKLPEGVLAHLEAYQRWLNTITSIRMDAITNQMVCGSGFSVSK